MFEECRMPNLSVKIEKVMPAFLTGRLSGLSKKYSKNKFNLAISQIARLIDKTLYEYQLTRNLVIEQINNPGTFNFPAIINHLENCINSLARILKFLKVFNDKNKEFDEIVPKDIKNLINKIGSKIKDFRDTIEHMDEKISQDNSDNGNHWVSLFINKDASSIEILEYKLSTSTLALVIEKTNKIVRLYIEHGLSIL